MAKPIVSRNSVGDKIGEGQASLWALWWNVMLQLRPAFSRTRSFFWFAVIVAGLTVGTDTFGVMAIVRALDLDERSYEALVKFFQNGGVRIDPLAALWAKVAATLFPTPVRVGGRRVLVGDGIKVAKYGKNMPGVKLLHQQSENKAEFIMGHSFQAIGMLVNAAQGVMAVPLIMRIHEGVVFSNAHKKTLLDKMLSLLDVIAGDEPYIFVADAYYAAGKFVRGLLARGNHLVTRVRSNAVAYTPYIHQGPRKRGRPRIYGEKIELASLVKKRKRLRKMVSPLYGETDVVLRYIVHDLLWKPAGILVRFVLVVHPTKGSWFLLSSDTSLTAIEIVRTYGMRFRIELCFRQAVHTIGTFCYRFWMKAMTPLRYGDGNQYLHRKTQKYRETVKRKLHAYQVFVQAGVIAQGLTQYLSAVFPHVVWALFRSRLRTIRPGIPPSELVVAQALRQSLPHFLVRSADQHAFTQFITERQDFENATLFRMAA
jgi:hypothetical protein